VDISVTVSKNKPKLVQKQIFYAHAQSIMTKHQFYKLKVIGIF